MSVRPAKTQISLGIRPVWSESSLCAQWVAKDPSFLHADSKDSDQTGRMPRLIWVFAGRTLTLLVLSCRGSYSYHAILNKVNKQTKKNKTEEATMKSIITTTKAPLWIDEYNTLGMGVGLLMLLRAHNPRLRFWLFFSSTFQLTWCCY